MSVRIADLLTTQHKSTPAPVTLYLLYDIKKLPLYSSLDDLDDDDMGTDTEEELNMDNEDESSHSSGACSKSMISQNVEENK